MEKTNNKKIFGQYNNVRFDYTKAVKEELYVQYSYLRIN